MQKHIKKQRFNILVATLAFLIGAGTMFGPSSRAQEQRVPPADPAFTVPVAVGPASPLYMEWPKLAASPDGTLHAIVSWGYRDHILYFRSTDQGRTWSGGEDVAGNPLWGGAAGNFHLVASNDGCVHLYGFELYGPVYPSNKYRKACDGQWTPPIEVPGSGFERTKITALTVDGRGIAHILSGKSGTNLRLYTTDGVDFSAESPLPLIANSYPNRSWLPNLTFSSDGKLLVTWGDYRPGRYVLGTGYPTGATGSSGGSWSTYFFTETLAGGEYQNGYQQYRVALQALPDGDVQAAFEGRLADSEAKDIYLRRWNPARYGAVAGGWATQTVQLRSWPNETVAPELCADARGQVYAVWMDQYDNMMILYSYSSDGLTWQEPRRVNAGAWQREKHPTCAVTNPTASSAGKLHVMWTDRANGGDARLYYASRPLPDLYPITPTVTIKQVGR